MFYMEEKDINSDDQNSGVTMEAMTGNVTERYYGRVEEIWELNYSGLPSATMFLSDGLRMYREKTDISLPCVYPTPIAVPSTPSPKMSHGYTLNT